MKYLLGFSILISSRNFLALLIRFTLKIVDVQSLVNITIFESYVSFNVLAPYYLPVGNC